MEDLRLSQPTIQAISNCLSQIRTLEAWISLEIVQFRFHKINFERPHAPSTRKHPLKLSDNLITDINDCLAKISSGHGKIELEIVGNDIAIYWSEALLFEQKKLAHTQHQQRRPHKTIQAFR